MFGILALGIVVLGCSTLFKEKEKPWINIKDGLPSHDKKSPQEKEK